MTELRKLRLTDASGNPIGSHQTVDGDYHLGVQIQQDVYEDPNNSSIVNLTSANSYTFIGTGTPTLGVAGLQWNLKTDQNATVYVEQSDDNTNWDISDSFDYFYSKGGDGGTVQAITAYWRIRVVLDGITETTYFRLKGILCPIANPLPRALNEYERLKTSSGLIDEETGKRAQIEPLGALKTIIPTRLVGTPFGGFSKDTNFWTEAVTGSGTVAQDGKLTLSTGVTADSTAMYQSSGKARKSSGTANQFRSVAALTTDAQVNNIRRIGPYDADNGFFFQSNGATFQVVSRKNGVDTEVSSGSYNGNYGEEASLVINILYRFIIEYTANTAKFFVNGILLHTIQNTVAGYTNTLDLPITMENINSGGNVTDNTFVVEFANILRLGQLNTECTSKFINTDTTTVCKYGAGRLARLINCDNAGNILIYDNTEASGKLIAEIDTGKVLGSLEINIPFDIGLTVVTQLSAIVLVAYE